MNVTLDMNCIIDLEERTGPVRDIETLIRMHKQHRITLRIPAICASERRRNGRYTSNFAEFRNKIVAIGLDNVEILRPIARFDMTFLDWCVFAGKQMVDLERRIQEVLFPRIEFAYGDYCRRHNIDPDNEPTDRRWRNAKCDVITLWSHVHYGSGIFVTTDSNFHKRSKKPHLISLGAGHILKPGEAVSMLINDASTP